MDVQLAAADTRRLLHAKLRGTTITLHENPARAEDGLGLGHYAWLLDQVARAEVTGDKAHRWLGWAQCGLAVEKLVTLTELKTVNAINS